MFDFEKFVLLPLPFWLITFFIFGTIVGSFLNVCIYRIPRGESIIFPPSHCPNCKYHIPWYLNIPLFTWLFLKGKCANCGKPISIRYFIVEFLTGCMFMLSWLCVGGTSPILALIYSAIISALIVASYIDFEHYIIPDPLTLGGIIAGFILSFLFPILHQTTSQKISLQESAIGIITGAGLLYLISRIGKMAFGKYKYECPPGETIIFSETAIETKDGNLPYDEIFYRSSDKITTLAKSAKLTLIKDDKNINAQNVKIELTPLHLKLDNQIWETPEVKKLEITAKTLILPREVMGLGDVKLMGAIGAFFGWKSIIFILFTSSLIGSLVGIFLILIGKNELSSRIPYGPYIAIGAILWMFGGYYYVVNWVNHMLRPLIQ